MRIILVTMALLLSVPIVEAAEERAAPSSMNVDSSPSMQERFRRLDANGDGVLTWDEARPARQAELRRLDSSKDGTLTSDEFVDRAVPFAMFDANQDGRVSMSEYLAEHQKMFERADTDRNGTVSLAEFTKAQQMLRGGSDSSTGAADRSESVRRQQDAK